MDSTQITNVSIAAVLVMLSGLFSGLNLGLMTSTDDDLKIMIEAEGVDEFKKKCARRILPLRKRGNLLLCTLLLGNTLVNALIAILLAEMTSGVIGGIVTTGLIVVFGEIIPQSVCSRYSLQVGARAVPIVWCFVFLCGIVAWPISKILDSVLGPDPRTYYSRGEFAQILKRNEGTEQDEEEENRMALGAMEFGNKLVSEHMTPLNKTYEISVNDVFDFDTLLAVAKTGHTRIPVYDGERQNVIAILLTKDLLGVGFERKVSVRQVMTVFNAEDRVIRVSGAMNLKEAKKMCIKQKKHLLVVTDNENTDKTIGVITMEDIIEEIIKEEIVDEHDLYIDNLKYERYVDRVQPTRLLDTLMDKQSLCEEAVRALVQAAAVETDPKVGQAQVDALGKLAASTPMEARDGIVTLLQHSIAEVRQSAATQLGILAQLRSPQLALGRQSVPSGDWGQTGNGEKKLRI